MASVMLFCILHTLRQAVNQLMDYASRQLFCILTEDFNCKTGGRDLSLMTLLYDTSAQVTL